MALKPRAPPPCKANNALVQREMLSESRATSLSLPLCEGASPPRERFSLLSATEPNGSSTGGDQTNPLRALFRAPAGRLAYTLNIDRENNTPPTSLHPPSDLTSQGGVWAAGFVVYYAPHPVTRVRALVRFSTGSPLQDVHCGAASQSTTFGA